jgi:very-short-patch-repair endonuclease
MPRKSISDFRRETAKRLRENMTWAERLLWHHLKRIPLHGTHFRRQTSIDRYVVDFVSHNAGLIIELDGSQHGIPDVAAKDRQRTAFLESREYRVVRFWNEELRSNLEGVLDTIYAALYGSLEAAPTQFERRHLHKLSTDPHPDASRRPSP